MSTLLMTTSASQTLIRLIAVAVAMAAALAIWTVAEAAFGIDVRAPVFDGSPEPLPIRAVDVLLVSMLLSFAGWGFLAILERLTARAAQVWLTIAVAALALSLATPWAGTGVSVSNRVMLMLLHLAVGSVLIPALYRTSVRQSA